MSDIRLDLVYVPTGNLVAREIEGELIVIPLSSNDGDGDELYTFNETGKEIWKRLDGKVTLKQIAEALSAEYDAALENIEQDLLGLVEELCNKKLLVEVSAGSV